MLQHMKLDTKLDIILSLSHCSKSFIHSFTQQVVRRDFPGSPVVKNLTSNIGKKETATHSSTLAWKIPWMEEPGRLQSMGSHRVTHN